MGRVHRAHPKEQRVDWLERAKGRRSVSVVKTRGHARRRASPASAQWPMNQCYLFDVNGLETGGSGRSIVCGPDGRVIYQAEGNEEIIPIELNIERVKRSRELGVLRLGQPLKSFRDPIGQFSIYQPAQNCRISIPLARSSSRQGWTNCLSQSCERMNSRPIIRRQRCQGSRRG